MWFRLYNLLTKTKHCQTRVIFQILRILFDETTVINVFFAEPASKIPENRRLYIKAKPAVKPKQQNRR